MPAVIDMPLYLYALIRADAALPAGLRGMDEQPLQLVRFGSLAAVVSPLSQPRIRPQRANLLRHHALLAEMLRQQALLPFAFGTIAAGHQALVRMLALHADQFESEFERIGSCVEMSICCGFDSSDGRDPHAKLAALDPNLQSNSRQIFAGAVTPARNDLIALGMQFEQVLEQTRAFIEATVVATVETVCVECKVLDCHGAAQLLNLACLVRRELEPEFERACAAAARQLGDELVLRISGPWAAHSFVNLVIHPAPEHVHHR